MPDPEVGRPDKHCSRSHGAMVKAKDRNQTIYKSAHHYKSRYIFKGIYSANDLYIYTCIHELDLGWRKQERHLQESEIYIKI